LQFGFSSHLDCKSSRPWPILACIVLTLSSALLPAQTPKPAARAAHKTAATATRPALKPASAAAAELQARIDAAVIARQHEDPAQIREANRKLIGLGLRRMGSLRLYQGALPESVSLYKRALDFEDVPDAHVDLAISLMRANRQDEALHEVSDALVSAPENARAWHLQGKVLMMKRDYRAAIEPLEHSVALQANFEAAYALAISELQLHEKERAAAIFQQILERGGDRAGFHVLFARAYRDATYMDDAERELRRALALDARTTRAHYFLGLLYMVRNEWSPTPAAIEQFQAEIKENPKDFFGNYFMGVIRSGAKRYEESDQFLKIAAAAKPDWPEPWLYLGLNAAGRSDSKNAEPLLRRAIDLTGKDEARNNYQIRRAYYALGRALVSQGKREEGQAAISHSRELQQKTLDESHSKLSGMGAAGAIDPESISREPPVEGAPESADQPGSDPLAHANLTDAEKKESLQTEQKLRAVLGNAFNDLGTAEARGQNYEVALGYFREAQQWNPAMPGIDRSMGIAAARLNRYADAAPALRRSLDAQPQDAMVRSLLGASLFMTDNYVEAAKTFAPLGATILNDPGLAYMAAASMTKTGNFEQSRKLLDALEKRSLPPELSVAIGQTRSEGGDYEGALKSLRRALAQEPNAPRAHYYCGLALIRLDRPAEAVPELRSELALHADDADVKYHLAYALLQLSSKAEAMQLLRDVIASKPDYAEAHYQLGKALMDDGQLSPAIEQLEVAARLKPQLDYVHYQLQAAYRKDSRLAEADRELKLYRELKARNRDRATPQPDEHP
jgi:tetratricopeptide (TPR) repeat protein